MSAHDDDKRKIAAAAQFILEQVEALETQIENLKAKIFTASVFAIVFVSPAHAAESCDKIRNILTRDNRVEILDFSNGLIVAAHNFSGGMTILCGSEKDIATDLTIGVNTNEPDKSFMAYFGDLAHRITGVNAKDAESAAGQCYKSARGYKGTNDGLFSGDQINTKIIHTDCRVGNNFTSFGVFSRRGMRVLLEPHQ